MNTLEKTDSFYLKLPNSIAVIGSSRSGKSTLISRFLDQLSDVCVNCPHIARFTICYSSYQPVYDEMIASIERDNENVEVLLFNYYPEEKFQTKEFWEVPEGSMSLIVMDDMGGEVKSSFEKMLRVTLHHENATLLYLSQDHSGENEWVKRGLRSVGYYFLTKSSHSGILLSDLNRKLFLYSPRLLARAYEEVMKVKSDIWPYLLLDLTVDCDDESRIRTGIFKGETGRIYRPVNN